MAESNTIVTQYRTELSVEIDDANEIELMIELGTDYDGACATLSWEEAEQVASRLMAAADSARRAQWRSEGRCVVCGGVKDTDAPLDQEQCDPTGCPGE